MSFGGKNSNVMKFLDFFTKFIRKSSSKTSETDETMAKEKTFIESFKSVKSDKKKLRSLFKNVEAEKISDEILKNIDKKDLGLQIWQDSLTNVKDETKLFEIIKNVSASNSRKFQD